jgi:hypothetical protein
VADAVLHTAIYADLFDYPLTSHEIHRYLTAWAAPLALVEEHLAGESRLRASLACQPPYWYLAGRDELVALRQEREAASQALWPAALRYGDLVAALPFVRLTAVTGSLAMNNATSQDDDIDLLIVASSGRVWLARGLVILVVHLAQRQGLELCPNYVLAEDRLELDEPSLFTAHELAQLVPLQGIQVYHRLLESNAWRHVYLPNAAPRQNRARTPDPTARGGQRLAEAILGGRIGDRIEAWERQRKIPRLQELALQRGAQGARYTPELCKGHVNDHGNRVQERYLAQLAAHGF